MLPWGFWQQSMKIIKYTEVWSYLILRASIITTVRLTGDNSSGNLYEIIQDESFADCSCSYTCTHICPRGF